MTINDRLKDFDFHNSSFEDFVLIEDVLFYEQQRLGYNQYIETLIHELCEWGAKQEYVDYMRYRRRNIAIYAGSFSPFHQGHYNILQKAEQIFDKVIIARGINPEKKIPVTEFPEKIRDRQIVCYDGLLTDFINTLGYNVTLIRGLRNSTDLQYELTQYRYLQDLMPNIKVVSIFCDKEFEHISSSAIRMLEPFHKESKYLL